MVRGLAVTERGVKISAVGILPDTAGERGELPYAGHSECVKLPLAGHSERGEQIFRRRRGKIFLPKAEWGFRP